MLFIKKLLILILLTLLPTLIHAQAWMTGFSYRKKITITKSKVISTVTTIFPSTTIYNDLVDFPVYVEVNDKNLKFTNGACGSRIQDAQGRDISFALSTAPTVPLNFQMEEYDPIHGKFRCWLKINSLSSNRTSTLATEVYFYYGGSILHNPNSAVALQTWNSDFSKVWHMNSLYQPVGIQQMAIKPDNTNPTYSDGKLGRSIKLDGVSSYYTGGNETNTAITISGWVKLNTLGKEQIVLTNDSSGVGGFQLRISAEGKVVLQAFSNQGLPTVLSGAATIQNTGRWYYLWASLRPQEVAIYLDNALTFSTALSSIRHGPGGKTHIGASKSNDRFFNGDIDELRIQKGIIAKEWMTTCYANQSDPMTFLTFGNEEYNTMGFARFIGNTSQWNLPGNWSGNVVPLANSNIIIAAGKKAVSIGTVILNRLITETGSTLEIASDLQFNCLVNIANNSTIKIGAGRTLRFAGDVINNGVITGEPLSTIAFEGMQTGQEYSGSGSASVSILENNQSGVSNTLNLTATMEVNAVMNLKKGIVQSDRTVIMKASSPTVTASLLPVNTSLAGIIGDIVVEQYISGAYPQPATARGWRLLSSPVYTSTIADIKTYDGQLFKGELFVTGNGGLSNGFDQSPLNGATIYTHDQTLTGTLSQKYLPIKTITQKIEIGKGIYVFSRGSRHAANAFANQIQVQPFINPSSYIIKHVGKVFIGDLSILLLNQDSGNAGDGFNLLGNPYPSNLKWGDIIAENTTGFVWQFDPINAAYIVSDSPQIIIPSGTGFFVRVASGKKTGKITFSENSKLITSLQSIPVLQSLKSSSESTVKNEHSLKITLSKDAFEQPYLLRLTGQGYDGVDDVDAFKIGDGHVSISSKVNEDQLSIDSRELSKEAKVINLNVSGTESGKYKFQFETSSAMTKKIKLVDAYLNIEKEIKPLDNTYNFLIDKLIPASIGGSRFSVLLEQGDDKLVLVEKIKIYPNPFKDNLNVLIGEIFKENISLIITDMLGRVVNSSNINIGTSLHSINTQALSEGNYLLRLFSEKSKKVLTTIKLVKI